MGARGDAPARPGLHALAALFLAALFLAAFAPGRAACGAALASEAGDAQGDARAEAGSDAGSGSEQGPGQLIDTYMAGHEQDQGLAVMVSVGGGSVVERFYGLADASGGAAVDGQTTFEWGRCSDLLVWVSLMQLAEEGSLSLSSSVEGLLPEGVELPEGYGALDVLDLMDHTSGLDVALNGSRSSIPDGTTSVGSAFSLFSVEPQSDPGDLVAYTPYDALLGAAVVEAVSGEDFVSYVDEHIFGRIGMESTYLMVGGSPARMARQGDGPVPVVSLATGSDAPAGVSSPSSSTSSILSCCGTVSDLLLFANALMGVDGVEPLFDDDGTAAQMFEVTRTYPGLGVARSAHGLSAFPLSEGVFGLSATTSTRFSASVYVRPDDGLAIAIMANQAGRADLTQGIPRLLVGRSELSVSDASSPANGMWVGTYQDASDPDHGPAKLLTALRRVVVSVNDQGVLTFDGLTSTALGSGVYSADSASDQDVYRFHVSLERGSEFSRVLSDSYVVPWSTLAVEGAARRLRALVAAVPVVYGGGRVRMGPRDGRPQASDARAAGRTAPVDADLRCRHGRGGGSPAPRRGPCPRHARRAPRGGRGVRRRGAGRGRVGRGHQVAHPPGLDRPPARRVRRGRVRRAGDGPQPDVLGNASVGFRSGSRCGPTGV